MKNDDSMIDDDALQPQGSPKIPLWVLSHYPRYVPLLRLRSKLPNKYEDHARRRLERLAFDEGSSRPPAIVWRPIVGNEIGLEHDNKTLASFYIRR